MGIKRTIFAGLSKNSEVTIADIISEIGRLKGVVDQTILNLHKFKIICFDGYAPGLAKSTNDFIDQRIEDFGCYVNDFNRLIRELPCQVAEGHYRILKQMSADVERQERRCRDYKNANLNKASVKKDFELVDKVYVEAKELTSELLDLGSLADALSTFVGVRVKSNKNVHKPKMVVPVAVSEIDESAWKLPPETYLFVKIWGKDFRKGTKNEHMQGDYVFNVSWNGRLPRKPLDIRKFSQMHLFFDLCIAMQKNKAPIRPEDVKKILGTKQPPNRAIRDLNRALVSKLRRKFPNENIPEVILGYSQKEKQYKSLVPIHDEHTLIAQGEEDYYAEIAAPEFFDGVQISKSKSGKKAVM